VKLFDLFQKKEAKQSVQSDLELKYLSPDSFNSHLLQGGNFDLAAFQSLKYYRTVSAVFNAVNIITKEVQAIEPVVIEEEGGDEVDRHRILDLVRCPNADLTWSEFIGSVATYYIVTGNAFVVATGRPGKQPLEIFSQPPQAVSVNYGDDGFVESYEVSTRFRTFVYKRKEVEGRFRYFTDSGFQELWHIRTFNPNLSDYTGMGMSPLSPVFYEIEQHISASMHNLSLLNNGARLSTVMSLEEEVTDEQYATLREELRNYYSGPNNAGRPILVPTKMNTSSLGQTNNDMDFLNLKKEATQSIYNALGVPLPLVSGELMTYSNLEESNIRLYNSAVIPAAKRIYTELSNFLLPRYPVSENLIFTFDINDIPALEPVRSRLMREKEDLGIYTINELRTIEGLDDLEGGGADEVFKPTSEEPVAFDSDPNDEISDPNAIVGLQPIDDLITPEDEEQGPTVDVLGDENIDGIGSDPVEVRRAKLRQKFTNILRNKQSADGSRLFSDEEIEKMMQKYGL